MNHIWLYIWRFQPFHNGHQSIVKQMLKDNAHNVILLGIPLEATETDPYSFEKRKEFILQSLIQKEYNNIDIYPLYDTPSDEEWIDSILAVPKIWNADTINIYCWDRKNDSAIKVIDTFYSRFWKKDINIIEISRNILPISGTIIREKLIAHWYESISDDVPLAVYKQIKK